MLKLNKKNACKNKGFTQDQNFLTQKAKYPEYIKKFASHTESQENNLNEKRQSNDANIEMNHVLELSDKDFKEAIMKMLQ